jgi:hypothetical protein
MRMIYPRNLIIKKEGSNMCLRVKIVNLTAHPLKIEDLNGEFIKYPKCETPARVQETEKFLANMEDTETGKRFRLTTHFYGEVENLPAYDMNSPNVYVVSRTVYEACIKNGRELDDLVVPGKGMRDKDGNIIGAIGFCEI